MVDGWPLVAASAVPLAALALEAVLGVETKVALDVTLAVNAVLLFVVGWQMGKVSGLTGAPAGALRRRVAGLLGVTMIALKTLSCTDLASVGGMRSVVYSATGDSSVLQLSDRPTPAPGPGRRPGPPRRGRGQPDRLEGAGRADRPGRPALRRGDPGQDGAGEVDAVGEGVTGLEVGDRVWVFLAQHDRPGGTAAEYTVQPEHRVVRLPEAASYDVGASLGVPALTAHRALTVHEDGPVPARPRRPRRSGRARHRRGRRRRARRHPAGALGGSHGRHDRQQRREGSSRDGRRRPPRRRLHRAATRPPRSARSPRTASTWSSTSR